MKRELPAKLHAFQDQVVRCIQKAYKLYDLYLHTDVHPDSIKIEFYEKGKAAGYCGYYTDYGVTKYYLKFNIEAIEKHYDEMVSETMPHEVAHLVAYLRPDLGAKNHNRMWKKIDRSLGGTGERCHTMKLTPKRKVKKYLYRVGNKELVLTSIRHNRIMRGAVYYIKTNYSSTYVISKIHFVSEFVECENTQVA